MNTRERWSLADVNNLKHAVEELGGNDIWIRIAAKLENKWTAFQCRNKWNSMVGSMETRRTWIQAEDDLLMQLMSSSDIAYHWNAMAHHFENRTGPSLKNRYYALKRMIVPVSEEDDTTTTEIPTVDLTWEGKVQLDEPIFPADEDPFKDSIFESDYDD
jgi:hypothetical protein